MNRYLFIAAALALSGCAAKIIDSNPRTVMVNAGSADPSGAMALAKSECGKHGRYAKLNTKPNQDRQWVFDCIE